MRGPSDGYKSGRKRHYRRRIWNVLEATPILMATPRSERRVLLLDESGAEETKFLVARGYRPSNITLVNLNVATAARASLSLHVEGIHGVEARGGDVATIWEDAARKKRRYHAVHLDFCGNVNPIIGDTLEGFNGISALGPVAFAVNVLRGRESNDLFGYRVDLATLANMRPSDAMDYARRRNIVAWLQGAAWDGGVCLCRQHLVTHETGTYVSPNGQSFLWVAGEFRSHGEAVADGDHLSWMAEAYEYVHECQRGRVRDGADPRSWAIPFCLSVIAGHPVDEQPLLINALLQSADASGNELKIRMSHRARQKSESLNCKAKEVSKWWSASHSRSEKEAADPRRQPPVRTGRVILGSWDAT